jgi:hypothetical protein
MNSKRKKEIFMKAAPHHLNFILLIVLALLITFAYHPTAYAFESTKIVLPAVIDSSGYNSSELNAALLSKLRSQFRFPKYDILQTGALVGTPDRSTLEKITNDNGATGAVVVEIQSLRNRTVIYWDETYDETDLTLRLYYFDKQSGKYDQFKTNRSTTQIASIYSGAQPESLEAMEILLKKLDMIFPRQFPGPRY